MRAAQVSREYASVRPAASEANYIVRSLGFAGEHVLE